MITLIRRMRAFNPVILPWLSGSILRQSMSIRPNGALRVKLADAYARKGLYTEANYQLDQAAASGATSDAVAAEKARIDQMMNGQTPAPDKAGAQKPDNSDSTTGSTAGTSDNCQTIGSTSSGGSADATPATAASKMLEGDKLWNQGNPDDAALAYKDAIKLDPNDWRAYERLAVVDASMSHVRRKSIMPWSS